MKITVCELKNGPQELEEDWGRLVRHVRSEQSGLVLLPEMPFAPWPAGRSDFDPIVWEDFVQAHEAWLSRFNELGPAVVAGSRPIDRGGQRFNEAFVWDAETGYRGVHLKAYLPDDEGFWEASWYSPGGQGFVPVDTPAGRIGFLVCSELWFTAHAIDYARAGVQILACPRATAAYSTEKWKAGGVAAAVMSGAYCISSNRGGIDSGGMAWGGAGWIIDPESGEILALTSQEQPAATLEVDLSAADRSKGTYPRYIYIP
jgi:N-carbamoylputrescine amidase